MEWTNKTYYTNNNSIYSCIDETKNESTSEDAIEIIYDGKMDENMVKKSTDTTTVKNFNEYIGRKEKHSKKDLDIYNNNKCTNNKFKKVDDNKDIESTISGIPSILLSNLKILLSYLLLKYQNIIFSKFINFR